MSASGISCGRLPSKPSNNASKCAVSDTGQGKRAVHFNDNARHLCIQVFGIQQISKSAAAFIGPTVCELDGPMPILKISKILIMGFSLIV